MRLFHVALFVAASTFPMPVVAQTPPVVAHEREFIGKTWSGSQDAMIPGYEALGGGFARDRLAVSFFRGTDDPRQWILLSTQEIGRDGSHARWLGRDTVRGGVTSRNALIAFSCNLASTPSTADGEPGLIGIVADDYAVDDGEIGLLRTERAWRLGADGRFTPVSESVVCVDDAYGV